MSSSPESLDQPLQIQIQKGVASLWLNRPSTRNALARSLLEQLEEAIEAIARDRSVRVVMLGARGPVFCAGHDLGEMVGRTHEEYLDLFQACSRVMLGLRGLPQPVIARVQGMATAAGCQLVAAADLAVASTSARFATPGVGIGLFCTTPMVPLMRAVPSKGALEMLFTGQPISAERARELGLVNRVVPPEELDAAVDQLAGEIIAMSPQALELGKRAFYELAELDESTAYARAAEIMAENATLADAQEGIAAFLQKRPPRWSGSSR